MKLGVLATHPVQYHVPVYRALAATAGVDLTVYFAHRPSPVQQGAGFGVPFAWDVDLLSGYRSTFQANAANSIRSEGFDAFLVQGWHARSLWQAMRACWAAGVPVLVQSDSQLRDDGWLKRRVKALGYPWFLGRAAACLSPGVRSDAYLRYYGARRIVRTPHSVDNATLGAAIAQVRTRRAALRTEWGIGPDRRVVLFVGKCVARKRPGDLIEALRGVPKVHALIVGDGPLRAECERRAKIAGVPATFTGFLNQSEIPRAYAVADLLVLPSDRRETWGMVVNEAMAAGLPVVAADAVGCVPDLVHDGRTGFAYPARDVRALARCVARLCTDTDLRMTMGRAAAAHIAAYTPAHTAAGVLEGAAR